MRSVRAACLVVVAGALAAGSSLARPARGWHTLVEPFRETQQTLVPFGVRSHWLQPWRGYLQTVPASRLTSALGINFNPRQGQAGRVARELAAAGIHRARIEISWCRVSDTDPPHLTGLASIRQSLLALRRNHIRPLVLLNAHHGCPGPLQQLRVHVVARAPEGARELELDPQSVRQVVRGRTGLDSTTTYKAAAFLFTQVSGTTVTLSQPLDRALAPGWYAASTLEYEPFTSPGDPQFDRTLSGWLTYVGLVTHEVKAILGDDRFDVEVWNELSFGSDFLDVNAYYDPPLLDTDQTATERAILTKTIAYLRDPANGVSDVGIGDGFASERPWESGSNVPPGLTAIDKHPYPPRRSFPRQATFNGVRPVDALGRPEGTKDAAGHWHDAFIPTYTSFFPEYFLSAIQTETVIRDLSPLTTDVYTTPHGRATHPPGSSPPQIWVTEAGMDPAGIPPPVLPSFHAKQALRWATAWVNKGASAVYYYAVSSPGYGLVDAGAPDGGATLRALGRLTRTLQAGSAQITRPLSVQLSQIQQQHDLAQFAGDGTPAHPPLYDRDVLGFFPFQVSNHRAVIALYVMTRDLMHAYRPQLAASDPTRYDMPPESFRLTIDGVAGLGRRLHLEDPLTGRSTPVHVVSRSGRRLVVEVALTDYPRLLVLS